MYTFSKSPTGINVIFANTKSSASIGGVGAVRWIDACGFSKGLKKACTFKVEDNEQVIIFNTKLAKMLSLDERNAIILHEEGHIVLDHLNSPDAIALSAAGKCPSTMKMELEADAYAAAHVGKAVVLSALKKVIDVFCFSKTFLVALGITSELTEDLRAVFEDGFKEALSPRYAALS